MIDEILTAQIALRQRDENYVLATVIETTGSASAKTGSKAVIDQTGRLVTGWIGGGCIEATVCDIGLECLYHRMARTVEIDLNDEIFGVGMPCGGTMRIYLDPVFAQARLWLLGHNRIAQALCHLAVFLDYKVFVHNPVAKRETFTEAHAIINDDLSLSALTPRENDYAVIATQHKGDIEALQRLLSTPIHYIALVASQHRADLVKQRLIDLGYRAEDLTRVLTPAGLNLGATTPQEIALAVVSDLVLTHRKGRGERLGRSWLTQKTTLAVTRR